MGIFTLRWRGALHEYKGIRAGVDGVDDVLDLGVVVEELDVGAICGKAHPVSPL